MSDIPPNVKVYDRPERAGLSPVIIGVIVLAVLIVGYFIYRAMKPSNAAPQTRTTSAIRANAGQNLLYETKELHAHYKQEHVYNPQHFAVAEQRSHREVA